jgi:signal transduction histidine kinase/DNA-binding response OmpR family regulator
MPQTITPPAESPATRKANILLVDDQESNLLALETILGDLGQNLVRAQSGPEALRHLLHDDFAVILLDVRMEGMDGFETARLIRGRKKSRFTPIIFLTAYETTPEVIEKAYALGAVDFLSKPVVPIVLRTKVAGFIELYEKTEQVRRQAELLRQREREAADAILSEHARLAFLRADASAAFAGGKDMRAALQECAEAVVRHLGAAFARIWTLDGSGETLILQASAGMYTHLDGAHGRVKVGEFKIGRIARERQPHLTNAVMDDPWISDPQWARRESMVAFAGYPLLVEGRLLGVLAMFARQPFSERVLADLHPVTDSLAQYIERRQAHEELERRVRQRTAELSAAIEALRNEIQERKEAEERAAVFATELQRSNRELEQFASVASHDLQEPLRKIQAFGDRLHARCSAQLSEQGRDYLERMRAAAARMSKLINDLLVFARVTTRAQPFVEVDLDHEARHVVSDLEGRLQQTGGRIEIGSLPTLQADLTQIRQLMQNLIGNALKFHRSDEPPIVWVQGRLVPDANGKRLCEITVRDNGIGFDEKYRDRIFQLFERLHGRDEYEGTGIGLAICRKIVERHGGTITAQSAPEQGATFTVLLPAQQITPELTS